MISKPIKRGMALAGFTLAGAAALKIAAHAHLFGADSADRSAQMLIGLTLAIYANYIPKTVSPPPRPRQALRAAGWTFTIAGLLYALVWAVTPAAVAFPLAMTIVGSSVVATFAYSLWVCRRLPAT